MMIDCMFGFLITCSYPPSPYSCIPTHTQAAYIPIPQSTSTVDMSTGAITHTIIIMREATKPAAVLRVKPVEATTTAPLFGYVFLAWHVNGMWMTNCMFFQHGM